MVRCVGIVGGVLIGLVTASAPADGATLMDLLNGGFLDAGGTRFTDWQLVDLDFTAATGPDLSQIVVLPLVDDPSNPGLHFSGNGQLSITDVNAIDLSLSYRAEVLGGGNTLTAHTSSMTGITFGGTGGIAFFTDSMTTGLGADLGSTLSIADRETPFFQFTSTSSVSPQSDVFVTTNVFVTGLATTDSIDLSAFTHRFAQNGPLVLAGDYNQNGSVDAADYVVWRKHVGAPAGTLPNDVSGGVIGQAQYDAWRARFGISYSASSAIEHAVVPEPATVLLGMLLMLAASLFRTQRAAA